MKFTPENLLQIYLDGSFTEEAQAEFDALMRKDSVFAEQVTKAVAERLGPAPDSLVDGVATRLDGKINAIWQKHKPSPYGPLLKKVALVAVLGLVGGSLYLGFRHFGIVFHPLAGSSSEFVQGQKESGPVEEVASAKGGSVASTTGAEEAQAAHGSKSLPSLKQPMKFQGGKGSAQDSSKGLKLSQAKSPLEKSENSPAMSSRKTSVSKDAATSGSGLPQTSVPNGSQGKDPSASSSMVAGTKTEEGFPLLIPVEIDKAQKVEMSVMDSKGFPVRQLYSGAWEPGTHTVEWDGKDGFGNAVLPGDYTIILNVGGKTMSRAVNVPAP